MIFASGGALGRHIATSSVWALGLHLGSSVAVVGVTALLSRQLAPEELGSWILLTSIAMALATLAGLGLPESLVRRVSKLQTEGRTGVAFDQIRQAFLLTAAAVALVALALGTPPVRNALSGLIGTELSGPLTMLLVVWVAAWAVQTLSSACFRGMHDIRLATFFAGACRNWLLLALLGFMVWVAAPLELDQAVVAMVIALLLGNAAALALLHSRMGLRQRDPALGRVKQLSDAWPFLMNLLILLLIARSGLWALGALSTRTEVAALGIVLQLMVLVTLPLFVLNAVLPPIISSLHAAGDQRQRLERTLRSVTTLAFIPSAIVFTVMALFGEPLIDMLFGDVYGAAAPVLTVLAAGQCLNVLAGPSGTLLKMTDHQHELFRVNLLFGVVTVAASLAVASRYGALGIAVVTSLILGTQNAWTVALAYRRTGVLSCAYFMPGQLLSLLRSSPRKLLSRTP